MSKFSVDDLVSDGMHQSLDKPHHRHGGLELSPKSAEDEATESESQPSTSAAPICQTLSYFDVLMPHVQMACNNPFFTNNHNSHSHNNSSNSPRSEAMSNQQKLLSHHWLDILQQSLISGDIPASLFLQPLRKTKRIRTAFSPAQLIHLEKAFESNHYVIGNERKQLAAKLQLTETQVKVWFQNRRTKHKRIKIEGGDVSANSPDDSHDSGPEEDDVLL